MNRMLATAVEIDVAAGSDAEGARRATGEAGPAATSRVTAPDPEVAAKVQRRQFTAAYRLGILKQVGTAYQFRHIELQEILAADFRVAHNSA